MNQPPNNIEAVLEALSKRLQAMNSGELGRVAEVARAGRTAVWRLRDGKSGARIHTIARIEEAIGIVEAERLTGSQQQAQATTQVETTPASSAALASA